MGPVELYALQVFATVVTENELLARGREAVPHPAGRVAGGAAARERAGREADRSRHARRQGAGPDRRRPRRVRVRASLPRTSSRSSRRRWPSCATASAGRLTIGANESSTLYLLPHIERYRGRYPQDQGADPPEPVEQDPGRSSSRATSSSASPATTPATTASRRRSSTPTRWRSSCRRSTGWRADAASRSPSSARRRSSPTTSLSPYRDVVLREFQRHKVPLQHGRRDADARDDPPARAERRRRRLPAADVRPRRTSRLGAVREVTVKELHVERKVRLLYAKARTLSHAAQAFLESRRRQA